MQMITDLRPEYYEYFPNFSSDELLVRLNHLMMPVHQATLLTLHNLSLCAAASQRTTKSFFRLDARKQGYLFGKMLCGIGVSERAAAAVANTPRERFVPSFLRPVAYVNHSLHFDSHSCLSTPGLVALMIEQLQISAGQRILEIGVGSGYHAACISTYLGDDCEVFGIDVNADYLALGRDAVRSCGKTNIHLHVGDGGDGWPDPVKFDRIYLTASHRQAFPEKAVQQLRMGGLIQGIRPLTRAEFESESSGAWIPTTFGSYDDYITGEWRRFSCLTTCRRVEDGLTEISRLFNVRFTPFQDKTGATAPYTQEEIVKFRESLGI